MTFAAITTLPKTAYDIPHLTRAKHCQHCRKTLAFSTFIVSWKFFSTHTVDLFKIPDLNQRLKGDIEPPPSKQFLTKSLAWSEISFNFHLAE